jgi:hypothetical protein
VQKSRIQSKNISSDRIFCLHLLKTHVRIHSSHHQTQTKEANVNTKSNMQQQQSGRTAPALSLRGWLANTQRPFGKSAHPVNPGETTQLACLFNLRHVDWTHSIRGLMPLSHRITP